MVKVLYTGNYQENLNELLIQEPSLTEEINRRVKWFRKNPEDTRLDNHPLAERMEGKFAFSITGDIRIVYEWLGKNTARFLAIRSHKEVYK